MKIAAIICEYNPFHNGHMYQIDQIKKQLHPDYIIAVMSGDFVQRGTPAFCDKYDRARFSLSCDIDLVFELPVCYATASAEFFAYGAVSLLESLNCIDYLVFGAESDDLSLLSSCADIFLEEPEAYKQHLQSCLKQGLSFPSARATAASIVLSKDISSVIKQPNNILAIEYLKALRKQNTSIQPFIIKRTGTGYHASSFEQNIASASAIRNRMTEYGCDAQIEQAVPEIVADYLKKMDRQTFPVVLNDFSDLIFYSLIMKDDLENYLDYHPELMNRLLHAYSQTICVDDLISKVKSRNFTYARISRFLLHLMLDIYKIPSDESASFGKILGIRKDSTKLLKYLNQASLIPLIQKTSHYQRILPENALLSYEQTLRATRLYRHILHKKYGYRMPDELLQPLLIV
jgi:predicted nucleotidyltransferase